MHTLMNNVQLPCVLFLLITLASCHTEIRHHSHHRPITTMSELGERLEHALRTIRSRCKASGEKITSKVDSFCVSYKTDVCRETFHFEMTPLVRAGNNLKECDSPSGYWSVRNPLVCQKQINLVLRHQINKSVYCVLKLPTVPEKREIVDE